MKRQKLPGLIALSLIILLSPAFSASSASADEFVKGVYPATPPSAFTLFIFDPDLIGAWNTPLYDYEKKFIPEKYQNLPILGGWYGQGFTPDREMVMASGLKKAFLLESSFFHSDRIRQALKELGLTLLTSPGEIDMLPQCFRSMGHNFNREARGEELAVYAESALRSLDPIKDLPPEKKPRIYYAMGADGLSTSCSGESRSKFVDMAGGRNAMACSDAVSHARPTISFEELMVMDPDIILVESNELKKKVLSEDRWGILRATKEGRVYLVPRGPFSWNGHPPLTVLMGSRWLANVLYPDLFPFDVIAATKEFYGLFFRMEFTDDMVKELLDPSLAER